MLMPKRVQHRKQQRGRMRGYAKGGTTIAFGEARRARLGLKAMDRGWITNRQIEAARVAMTRKIKRGGKVWINIFPDKPVTPRSRRRPGWAPASWRVARRGLGRRDQARPRPLRVSPAWTRS